MSALIAFTGCLQSRDKAVVNQELYPTFRDVPQLGVVPKSAVCAGTTRPFGDGSMRNFSRKCERTANSTGQP